MSYTTFWCNVCDPFGRHDQKYLRCDKCILPLCEKCYYLHLDSCKLVVSKQYHLCVFHDKSVNGYCFTCCVLICADCRIIAGHVGHDIINVNDAILNIEGEINGRVDELDIRIKQIESRIELQKVNVYSGHQQCPQCKCSVHESIDDTCSSKEHFFGRLVRLKTEIVKVKGNLDYLKGERNPIVFLARWENPNKIITLTDAVLGMKQFDSVNDSSLPRENGAEVDSNIDTATDSDDIEKALVSAFHQLSVSDEKEGHTSDFINANCKVLEMLGVSECLPVLVKDLEKSPLRKRKFVTLPEESRHKCVNTFIGHVREAHNCIVALNNELLRVNSELKANAELLKKEVIERRSEKEEYERRIQTYDKDKKDGKGIIKTIFCGLGKTKTHDDGSCYNIRETITTEDKLRFQKSIEELNKSIAEKEIIIGIMKREKNDLESRLSALAGEQLTKGNPALTDLGDPNRPMKIGDKYGELYDNEWTESMDLIVEAKTIFPDDVKEHDDIIVHHLYRVLTECYKECKKESELQLEVFGFKTKEILEPTDENKEGKNISDPHTFDEGSFHRKRKQNAESFAKFLLKEKRLCKNITESWDYRWKSEDLVTKLLDTPFFQRCVYLCWSMVVQDPMMHLDDELPKDSVYDRNLYKEFVQK